MKVFSKKKFEEVEGENEIKFNGWVDYCDGKEVYERENILLLHNGYRYTL